MKLVEILARELPAWASTTKCYTQDKNGCAYPWEGGFPEFEGGYWSGEFTSAHIDEDVRAEMIDAELASDHSTAIITREMWESERARIEGEKVMQECVEKCEPAKKPKANKEGWIRHRGGKCPVEAGTIVDVRYRKGTPGVDGFTPSGQIAAIYSWRHCNDISDIMAYRLHKPEQPGIKSAETATVEFVDQVIGQLEGPLSWRDRIHEIDAASKEEEARHCAAMEAFDKERADLIAKLAAEGLALVERVESEPAEDMSDWRNWREGDLVTFVHESDYAFTNGNQYAISRINPESQNQISVICDDEGDPNGWQAKYFKFHSRPTA